MATLYDLTEETVNILDALEEADARYKEVFEKNSEFNPTVWIKTKFEYKRLSGY